MSTDFSDSVRKAGRLRAEVTHLDLDARKPGRIGRVYEAVVDSLMLVLLVVLAVDGWLAYRTFHHDSTPPASGAGSVSSAPMSEWPRN